MEIESKDTEKSIFDAIVQNDLITFKDVLAKKKGSVDIYDEDGMTALQHAAYKGNKDMVQLLLDAGADVSAGNHEYNYTALHFGALSGSSDVCRLLLEAGAQTTAVNSVGRTASEMAAFVGNHYTVSTINSFIPQSEIAYYATKQDQQTEPVLPPFLVQPLHKFVLGINLHPVRLALNIQQMPALLENAVKVSDVLEKMAKKEMAKGNSKNEVMALKYYYFSYIVKELSSISEKQRMNGDKKHDVVEVFSRKLLKPGPDGYSLDIMDAFLKECVRHCPFKECTSFKQMVVSLTSKDPPSALFVLNNTINGQRGFIDSIPYCSTCGEEKPGKKCSKCKSVQYCDRECQRLHWFAHKKVCDREASAPALVAKTPINIDTAELSSQLQNLVA